MDSNNINRTDNTNTPNIPAENIPPVNTSPNPVPPQGNFPQANSPYGDPADIPGRPLMQNNNTPSQGDLPYGTPNGQQNQGNTSYGYSNNLQNPNNNPYGSPDHLPNRNNTPYGNPNGIQNQGNNPYGNPNSLQNQGSNPYGNPNGSQNQNSNPYGYQNHPQNQSTPYGYPGNPQHQNANSYGMLDHPQNQNPNPYGSPNGMPYPNSYQSVQKSPADGLITATLALGIATIVSAILGTVYFPFILGGICIMLALLSKGYDEKMSSKPKIGIICSVVGLVLNILVVGTSVYKVFTDEQTFNQFDQVYERMYGESFRDMYKDATGQDFPFNFGD